MLHNSVSPVSSKEPVAVKVSALRARLADMGLDGFIVPHDDAFHNEMTPASEERLAFVTSFTGSAGVAVVLHHKAALFVDGRYTLQVREQTDVTLFDLREYPREDEVAWALENLPRNLPHNLPQGARLGFDPWLHSAAWAAQAREKARACGVELVEVRENPVDAVWADRPARVRSDVVAYPVQYAGEESASKRARLAAALQKDGVDGFVITHPDSLMWVLNIRGTDVACVPLALGYGVLKAADGSVDLFMDDARIKADVRAHLGEGVRVRRPDDLLTFLARESVERKFSAEFALAPAAIVEACGGRLVDRADVCVLPKACKNAVELDGMRACHVRDGVALVRFMRWLARQPSGSVDEGTVMARLREFRQRDSLFQDESFATIAGSGPNGAVVHYHTSDRTNRLLGDGELMVLDSGGQYLDGTTDVTRTVVCGDAGKLTAEMKDRFTRVLKGHIALARAVFPAGTSGAQLDVLARQFLWSAGLDYAHGTGHGVGCYLSVHEGPARIYHPLATGRAVPLVPLEAGMVLSNEPGYYKAGAYGIRHENLQAVVPVGIDGAEREMLGFEVLTLCPFDIRALEPSLLTREERDWLNAYHSRVIEELSPLLDEDEAQWLGAFCGIV